MDSLAKQKTKRDMRKALTSLPKELDETYDSAMERIRSQDTDSVRVAERALAWITNSRRPFSVEELQHALAVQPDEVCTAHNSCIYSSSCLEEAMLTPNHAQTSFDEEAIYAEDDLVSVCAGLVTIDRESHVIRLVHYTAQDYFERLRSKMFPTIQVEITKACIRYFLLDDLKSHELTHGEEHIEVSDGLHSRYPFLDYAGKHWGHHARGDTEYLVAEMISNLLGEDLRLHLACEIIDDSACMRDFGPIPALTVLVYFGLKRIISNAADFDQKLGLVCAIRYRRNNLVFLLVKRGEDWYDTGEFTIRAEFSSFQLEGNETMVMLLAGKGVTMDLSVDNGEFLFTRSWLKSSDTEGRRLMSTLLELGATFDPQNITYYTPLMCAVIEQWDIWKFLELLKIGIAVSEKNEHGRDALIYAALTRYEAVIRPLLEAGADVHSRDEDGMTALSAACKGGNAEIIKVLLERGADVSAEDKNGRTPMSIAIENGNAVLKHLLRGEGTHDDAEEVPVSWCGSHWNAMWHLVKPDGSVGLPE